jgi:hypothetical protein
MDDKRYKGDLHSFPEDWKRIAGLVGHGHIAYKDRLIDRLRCASPACFAVARLLILLKEVPLSD